MGDDYRHLIPQEGNMLVPGLVIASKELMNEMEKPLQQVRNVACLPGIVGYSIAMPDIHWGYGFPIGGVAAVDAETGVISPGGVGYDINCGVRVAIVPEKFSDLQKNDLEQLLKRIFELVPSGVGRGQRNARGLSDRDYAELTQIGARWSVEKGMGFPRDLEHIESNGVLDDANIEMVSDVAKARGKTQLGSIGSGNHFVEIGAVEKILRPEIASAWQIEEGHTYILIHSGSRGFGHQVCQDTLDTFLQKGYAGGLPDRQLVCAPLKSDDGKAYLQAMAAAANFAFNNRQQILHEVRGAFKEILNTDPESISLLYDVCHNIAKFETHPFQGGQTTVCVHRKGATRAFGPGREELNPIFFETGQPVIVPGDMARASYLLVGKGDPDTWSSCCHGAGRARSRIQSKKAWQGTDLTAHMAEQGVQVMASSTRTIAEEMPDAYKDVDLVTQTCEHAGLAGRVARLKPGLVIKG